MTTLLVEALPAGSVSTLCTYGWRWGTAHVVEHSPQATLLVSDRLDTSVSCGRQAGWDAWLRPESSVLLGVGATRRLLRDLYAWLRPQAIEALLVSSPATGSLLVEANSHIKRYFGLCTITLDVSTDPEGGDQPRLVVRIHTDADPPQALGALDRFDSEWWLDASADGGDRVCITLGYS